MQPVFDFLVSMLNQFRSCFTRSATYHWFCSIILAFLVRPDSLGVTSFVRTFSMNGKNYGNFHHFFRSKGIKMDTLRCRLYQLLISKGHMVQYNNRYVMVGDGVKVSKEGRHMPAVKKMHQESEDSSKGEWIFGHLFGAISTLVSNGTSTYATPLDITIQDGLGETSDWKDSSYSSESHVIQMIRKIYALSDHFGKIYCILDRYFLSVKALSVLNELNKENHRVDIITRAKSNCIAYKEPVVPQKREPGRPKKRGDSVKLSELFKERTSDFKSATVSVYGKKEEVQYLCLDLLWGGKLYQKLRFVLVKSKEFGNCILVSTDITLSPVQIIELYALRFKIECSFRTLKQQFGAFSYHFWTDALPKLNHFRKENDPDPLENITDEAKRKRILSAAHAIELFVQCSCIAMNMVHMIALNKDFTETIVKARYLRTSKPGRVSEATVMNFLQKNFSWFMLLNPNSPITRFILPRINPDYMDRGSKESA